MKMKTSWDRASEWVSKKEWDDWKREIEWEINLNGEREREKEILRWYEWHWTIYVFTYYVCGYILTIHDHITHPYPYIYQSFCWKAHLIQIVTQLDYSHISYSGFSLLLLRGCGVVMTVMGVGIILLPLLLIFTQNVRVLCFAYWAFDLFLKTSRGT